MPIDPTTILYILPKPGGREAVLLHRLFTGGSARLEIMVAQPIGEGQFYAVRSIGIGPDLLEPFAKAVPEAVDAVLASRAQFPHPALEAAPAASSAKDSHR